MTLSTVNSCGARLRPSFDPVWALMLYIRRGLEGDLCFFLCVGGFEKRKINEGSAWVFSCMCCLCGTKKPYTNYRVSGEKKHNRSRPWHLSKQQGQHRTSTITLRLSISPALLPFILMRAQLIRKWTSFPNGASSSTMDAFFCQWLYWIPLVGHWGMWRPSLVSPHPPSTLLSLLSLIPLCFSPQGLMG